MTVYKTYIHAIGPCRHVDIKEGFLEFSQFCLLELSSVNKPRHNTPIHSVMVQFSGMCYRGLEQLFIVGFFYQVSELTTH